MNMKMSSFDEKIEIMYNDFFRKCKNTNCCGQKELFDEYDHSFLYDRGIEHSKNYENAKFKVLVVGMESRGCMDADNKYESVLNPGSGKGLHWICTVLEIIRATNEFDDNKMDELEEEYSEREKVCKGLDYAFTDYFKCAFSKNGDFSNDTCKHKELGINCSELFKQEIELLKPNLVIVQGINSKEIIDESNLGIDKVIKQSNKDARIGIWEYQLNSGLKFKMLITPFPMHRSNNEVLLWNNIKYEIYKLIDEAKK